MVYHLNVMLMTQPWHFDGQNVMVDNWILTCNLISVVPTMKLFQNYEKLEIVLSTDSVNLASHHGTIIRTKVSQNLGKAW